MKRIDKNNASLSSGKTSGVSLSISNLMPFNLLKCEHVIGLKGIIFTIILFLFPLVNGYSNNELDGKEPNKSLIYNIIKNEEIIGKIEIHLSTSGDSIIYDIESDVLAKFILKFKVVGKERYIYKKGTLVYSSLFRTLNDKVKTNHSILYHKGEYSLQTPEKISPLNFEAIKCNLIKLYVNEPIGITSVFCDNQQQMLKVEPIGKGIYRVEFSRGKYNIFYYENGRCVKVKAVSPLFDVTLIPVLS